jgi:hypothetical protein
MSAVLLGLVLLALAGTALDWVRKPVCRYLGGKCLWLDDREEIIHRFFPKTSGLKTSQDKSPPPDPPLPLPLSACHTYRWILVVVIWCRRGRVLIVWAVEWSRPLASRLTSTDCYGPPNRVHKDAQRERETYREKHKDTQNTQTLGKARSRGKERGTHPPLCLCLCVCLVCVGVMSVLDGVRSLST